MLLPPGKMHLTPVDVRFQGISGVDLEEAGRCIAGRGRGGRRDGGCKEAGDDDDEAEDLASKHPNLSIF